MSSRPRTLFHPEAGVGGLALLAALLTFGRHDSLLYVYWSVAVALVFGALAIAAMNVRIRRSSLCALLATGGWLVYPLCLTWLATNPAVHLKMIALTALYCAFAVVVCAAIWGDSRSVLKILGILAIVWIAVNLVMLMLYALGVVDYDGRSFSGVYANRNTAAVVGVFLLGMWVVGRDAMRRIFGLGVTLFVQAASVVIVLSTASTKGLIGLALFFIAAILMSKRPLAVRLIYLLGIACVTALVAYWDGTGAVGRAQEKVEVALGDGNEPVAVGSSAYQRVWLTAHSARLIADRPWTGVGVHNSQFHLFTERYLLLAARGDIEDSGVGVYSHNNYLEMLLNGGVVAFVAYYLPLFWLIVRLSKKGSVGYSESLRRFLLVALLVKLVLDVGMVSYFEFSHILLLAVAWTYVFRQGLNAASPAGFAVDDARPGEKGSPQRVS